MTRDACRRLRHFPPRPNWDRFRRRIDPTSVNGWSLGGEPTRRVVPLLILTASTLIEALIVTRVAVLCTVSTSTSASESTLRWSVPLRLSGGFSFFRVRRRIYAPPAPIRVWARPPRRTATSMRELRRLYRRRPPVPRSGPRRGARIGDLRCGGVSDRCLDLAGPRRRRLLEGGTSVAAPDDYVHRVACASATTCVADAASTTVPRPGPTPTPSQIFNSSDPMGD